MSTPASLAVDPRWRVVVVSTHFDDAVLSTGGFLITTDLPAAVLTAHGGAPDPSAPVSSWDLDCGFVSAQEAYATRREEDRRACAAVGADQVLLPNPDNPYRDGGPPTGLAEFLDRLDPGVTVVLPLGTNQPDHTAVCDAAIDLLERQPDRPLWVYADLPYAAALVPRWRDAPVAEVEAALEQHDPRFRQLRARHRLTLRHGEPMDATTWSRKRQAVFSYASQLSLVGGMGEVRHLGPMLRYPGALQRELIWAAQP